MLMTLTTLNNGDENLHFIEFVPRPVEPTTIWPSSDTRVVTTSTND